MFKMPDLDKMSESQRGEYAAQLRAQAAEAEERAEEAQRVVKQKQEEYDQQCERAYQLRKMAQIAESYGKK